MSDSWVCSFCETANADGPVCVVCGRPRPSTQPTAAATPPTPAETIHPAPAPAPVPMGASAERTAGGSGRAIAYVASTVAAVMVIVVAVVLLTRPGQTTTSTSGETGSVDQAGTTAPASIAGTSVVTSAPSVTETAPTNPPIPADQIRTVDFKNYSFEADTCSAEDPRGPYTVIGGTGSHGENMGSQGNPGDYYVMVKDPVVYGDLTGDGIEESVVRLLCSFGGNGSWDVAIVYSPTTGPPTRIGLVTPQAESAGGGGTRIDGVSIDSGRLVVHELIGAVDDPMCCPSLTGTTVWSYANGSMVPGKPSGPPPPQPLDPNGISIDGLAPIRLGMSQQEFTAVTGIRVVPRSTGCGAYPVDLIGAPDGVFVSFDDKAKVKSISVSTPAYKTLSGAYVGMSVGALRSLYRDLEFVSFGDNDPNFGQYAVVAANPKRSVVFSVSNGIVASIDSTYGGPGYMDNC